MERGHQHAPGRLRHQGCQALLHLGGGPPAEGDGQALLRRCAAAPDQMRQAVRERARLARSGAGDDQQRPVHDLGRLPLLGVEPLTPRPPLPSPPCPAGRGGERLGWLDGWRLRGLRLNAGEKRGDDRSGADLVRREEADHAVLAVVASLAVDVASAQARERLGEEGAAGLPHLFQGEALEDVELGAQPADELGRRLLHRARLHADAVDLRQHLRQRHQAAERIDARARLPGPLLRPVRELFDAVHHTHGERLAARRTKAADAAGLGRLQADAAGAVAVQMVLPFLGEELDRAAIPLAGLQGPPHGEVVEVGRERAGLAPQHRRRVGVRVADQGEAVEPRDAPVHRRIGGEPGLHREEVRGEVAVALLDRIEARLRAEHGEPGGPDVRRDQIGVGAARQRDLEQVPRVEAEDRPAVRGEVADRAELFPQAGRGLEAGGVDQVVDLAGPVPLFVDGRDLDLEEEPGRPVAGRRQLPLDLALDLRAQAEEPRLGRDELAADLLEPGRMREVAGTDDGDPLAPRPQRQVLEIGVPARGAGVLRVDMEIGVEHWRHGKTDRRNDKPLQPFCPPVPRRPSA